jgi:hypothetical protein
MTPGRYRRSELQEAYGAGYAQMHDHDAGVFRDRMELMVEHTAPIGTRSEAMAAACEGAAAALRTLAAQARESGKVERSLGPGGF